MLHGITPTTVQRNIGEGLVKGYGSESDLDIAEVIESYGSPQDLFSEIKKLDQEMRDAARELAFEKAAALRDRIKTLREIALQIG